jgi:hypothetical protein
MHWHQHRKMNAAATSKNLAHTTLEKGSCTAMALDLVLPINAQQLLLLAPVGKQCCGCPMALPRDRDGKE